MVLNALQEQEILNQQKETFPTRRATVRALEGILFDAIPLLDHGFIRVIDYMGDDAAIVQAARVSYGKGTKKISEDQGLINYLMRHRHSTPFEMCEIKFHVKLPIFVARQWIRHRTANVNEYSARYSILDKEFYIPQPEHMAAQSKVNNQGRGDILEGAQAEKIMQLLKDDAERAYDHYQLMLNETETGDKIDENEEGLARELARMNLPVNFYTQWYWKVDLHNFMHFLSLRADAHAQYEIRVYAEAMLEVMRKWVPATYQAFMDYRMGAAYLSAKGVSVMQALLAGKQLTREESGMSLREWRELESVLQIKLP